LRYSARAAGDRHPPRFRSGHRDNETAGLLIGSKAPDKANRIVYNDKNGDVFYEATGKTGFALVRFAEIDPGLNLTHKDFMLV
jgi:hypothetical protein